MVGFEGVDFSFYYWWNTLVVLSPPSILPDFVTISVQSRIAGRL